MKKFKINHQIILGISITLLSDKNSLKKFLHLIQNNCLGSLSYRSKHQFSLYPDGKSFFSLKTHAKASLISLINVLTFSSGVSFKIPCPSPQIHPARSFSLNFNNELIYSSNFNFHFENSVAT